jgi:DNA modification methylase
MVVNALYRGDNLAILRKYIAEESIDLIYLDPPFNSRGNYHAPPVSRKRARGGEAIFSFADLWPWNRGAEEQYAQLSKGEEGLARVMRACRTLLDTGGMLAYLTMMAPRLRELRRVLKPTGSIYVHCDPSASHYLRVLLDAIFGARQFRNEIVWRRTGAHAPRRCFGPIHDTLLFYTRSADYFFRVLKRPYMRGHIARRYRKDKDGRLQFSSGGNVLTGANATGGESSKPWRGFAPAAKNRHWAIPGFLAAQMPPGFEKLDVLAKLDALYEAGLIEIRPGAAWPAPVRFLQAEDGQSLADIWSYQPYTDGVVHQQKGGIDADVAWLGPTHPERLGYQTQKPLGLLERIINSSCPENGLVLDPFCGSGTTLVAAHQLKRSWVGIDQTAVAIGLTQRRLHACFALQAGRDYRLRLTAPSTGRRSAARDSRR